MRKLSLSLAAVAVAGFVSVANAALADGGAKFLGNITTGGQIRSDFAQYWNQITPENGCKWGSIHSLSNGNSGTSKFAWDNFDKCESAYKWAKEKPGERHFKFHALVWGSQYPNFLCKKKNPGITVELTKKYITEWFDAVAAKFPDLEYIDVVNEAIWAGNNYHSGYGKPAAGAEGHSTDDTECGGSYIIEALGGDRVVNGKHQYDFITNAFKMARERWPKAVLIYNDYNTLSWQINEGIELIQTIVKNGAPVDAYGQQAHDCKGMSKSDFESKMTRIHNETGLPLLVSEYDIGEADDTKQTGATSTALPGSRTRVLSKRMVASALP
ncbi:endo-1,4-beta-xylanase [Fibrobacter succinogenes]|uniref:endo-1,4-beta-xylanase n=1 Tax=Fibrobacter succinogenes TaxID=833 RepID=UPI0026EB3010|nr:endo-1,4-beta-xylanase [Fibrobacter succinogenes]